MVDLAELAWKRLRLGGLAAAADFLALHTEDGAAATRLWLDLAGRCRAQGEPAAASRCLDRVPAPAADAPRPIREAAASLLAWVGRFGEAEAFRRAIAADEPLDPAAHLELGVVLFQAGRPQEAVPHLREAVRLAPDWPLAHVDLGLALVAAGDQREGWERFEWRHRMIETDALSGAEPCPVWAGQDPAGKLLFVSGEQGFGDNVQFARFLPRLARCGARVIVAVRPPLVRLFRDSFPEVTVVGEGDRIPRPDYRLAMMSLPRLLGVCTDEDWRTPPYLRVPAARAARWRAEIAGGAGDSLAVGVAWASRGGNRDAQKRSLPEDQLERLARTPGIRWVSLQKGDRPPDGVGLFDRTDELGDFAETAALVTALDAVVSVDTAVLHVAAALGRPTFGLIALPTDWRWAGQGEGTRWYDTVRLLRQPNAQDWGAPVGALLRAVNQLRLMVGSGAQR